jgi:hypothetical protein
MEEPKEVKKRRSRVLEYYEKKQKEESEKPVEDDENIFQDTFGELGLDEFGTEPFK